LLFGDIFFILTHNMIPIRQQSAHDSHIDVCSVAVVSG